MTTAAVKQGQWQALNQKGSHKPAVNFASELGRAAAATTAPTQPLTIARARPALSRSDFAAGNAALPPDAAREMKPLGAHDFGGAQTTKLRALQPSDFVPGVKTANDDQHAQIQAQAEKWVSQTFYGTMLRQMNDSPFKSDLFSGGRGGQAFAPMLSQHLADRMAHAGSNKLVRSVVKAMEKKAGLKSATPAAGPLGSARGAKTPAAAGNAVNPYKDVRIHVAPNLGT
jgi:Rod binding domain-containing protein